MDKFLMGLFFLLVCVILVVSLQKETLPEVEKVGDSITEDVKDVYVAPTTTTTP